ncbi:MAG: M48 family metalloprotease [Candidatus Jordarchaeum sp.]|uniref:M48 family metalloprotease n=1 Tax=Candidatus Jordarchaeum sp. TaxID=2823881 RepID=UPI00404B7709
MGRLISLKSRMGVSIGFMFIVLFGFLLSITFLAFYFLNWINPVFGIDILTFAVISLVLAGITGLFILSQWAIGPSVVRHSINMRYFKKGENPWLESVVKELSEKSNLPTPKIGITPDEEPNAFVFGRTAKSANLVVTKGLLTKLNKKEIEAVIGHEIGHIKHKDHLVMTCLAAVPVFCFIIAMFAFHSLRFARIPSGRRRDGGAILLLLIAVAIVAMVAYIVGLLIVRTLSRMREFYSDAYSAYVTENPRGLKSALTKIAYGLSVTPRETKGVRAFFIEDPVRARSEIQNIVKHGSEYDLDKDGTLDEKELELAMEKEAKRSRWNRFNNLFSTHPPTYKRILLLSQIEKEMASGRYAAKNIYKYV